MATVVDSHVVFITGAGLEESMEPLWESAGAGDKVVEVSSGIELLEFEGHEEEGEEGHHHQADPHTWTDPNLIEVWVVNIEGALAALDPANAEAYAANAGAYKGQLAELDAWVRKQVEGIPPEKRQIVTDHRAFGYFCRRYGFEQVGTIIPGYSTLSEPSAKELSELEDAIRDLNVKAVFVGNTVNPALAEAVTEDTGARLVFLYTGSLSDPEGDAPTYLAYIRYNVNAIVSALR
jgi:ABC-type Zn uptake system ZnuABC Zn-binding protein ZnuA